MLDVESLVSQAAAVQAAVTALRERLTADVDLPDITVARAFVMMDSIRSQLEAVSRLLESEPPEAFQ